MSQHDMEITKSDANTGLAFRAAVNAALQALASNNGGATEPSPSFPNQWWPDWTTGHLKIRNTANTEWITVGKLSDAYLGLAALAAANEFSASQKLKGDALLWRLKDTGTSGKEWGIRSDGGNIEICENTGTEEAPTWTVRATINATGFSGDGSQLTGLSNPGIMGICRNLVITPPSSSTLDINADEILLQNTDGVTKRFAPVDLTVDITASGANGLDTGSEAASTWYAIWVIGKSDGTVAGLLSTSSTAPTMPSGYTFKAFVGWARNNASSNFGSFNQYGNITRLLDPGLALSSVASQSTVEANISAIVPPKINEIFGTLVCGCTNGWFFINDVTFSNSLSTATIYDALGYQAFGASANVQIPFFLHQMRTDQKIYYQSQGSGAYCSLQIRGFILR